MSRTICKIVCCYFSIFTTQYFHRPKWPKRAIGPTLLPNTEYVFESAGMAIESFRAIHKRVQGRPCLRFIMEVARDSDQEFDSRILSDKEEEHIEWENRQLFVQLVKDTREYCAKTGRGTVITADEPKDDDSRKPWNPTYYLCVQFATKDDPFCH